MGCSSLCAPELWVGDRWVEDTGTRHVLRVTMVDLALRLVEAQDDATGATVDETFEAFVSTHRQLGRSELAAEHGW